MFESWGVSDSTVGLTATGILILIAFAVKYRRKQEELARAKQVEIARIEETAKFSDLGVVAVLLLIAHQAAMVAWMMVAKSAVQEASVGTIWIAGNVLFGVLAVIGRRRSYRVLRDPDPVQPVEPRA